MNNRLGRRLRASRPAPGARRAGAGQTYVEFAIISPLLFALLFGIISFGMAIHAYSFVCYAAREATRYAIVRGATSSSPASASDIENYVLSEAIGLDPSKLTVTTSWDGGEAPGSAVKVTVTYAFAPFYPMSGATLNLSISSQMVISE